MTEQQSDQRQPIFCPNCGSQNRPGSLACESCGELLSGDKVGATYRLDESEFLKDQTDQLQNVNLDDRKIHFPEDATFAIQIREVDEPMTYQPGPEQKLLVGRRNKVNDMTPDIDFYPFAGFLLGVSRRHATIYKQENRLVIEDLGSSNGTFVNGVRLEPNEPYPLYDGVEVSLGKLHFTIRF